MASTSRRPLSPHDVRIAQRSETRAAPRESVDIEARLRVPDVVELPVKVRNLSAGGFMAETEGVFTPGAAVMIALPAVGDLHARVVWSTAGSVGCQFPVALDVFFPSDPHPNA